MTLGHAGITVKQLIFMYLETLFHWKNCDFLGSKNAERSSLILNSQRSRALALYPEQSGPGWYLLHHVCPLTMDSFMMRGLFLDFHDAS